MKLQITYVFNKVFIMVLTVFWIFDNQNENQLIGINIKLLYVKPPKILLKLHLSLLKFKVWGTLCIAAPQ